MHIKYISAGAGLFGFGALIGWAVTSDLLENKYAADKEMSESRIQHLRRQVWALDDRLAELEAASKPEGPFTEDPGGVEEADDVVMSDEEEHAVRSNLEALIEEYASSPSSVQSFVNNASTDVINNKPPFVISRMTYAYDEDEGDQYDKITLTYFKRHRILLDEEEEPIDDVPGTVGWKNLSQFGGESDDPNVVFIRNRRLLTDFEVILDEEDEPPLHIKYGMPRDEFRLAKAAGVLKLRPEDRD